MFFRLIFLLLLIVFLPFSSASNNHHNVQNNLNQVINSFSQNVKTELKNHNIPGAAYVIIKNNNVVSLQTIGFTDRKKTQKINQDTVFRLASVSKPFAATITTMLAQDSLINLSDPVTKYIPDFTLAEPGAAEKIKLKHILSHSSGLMPNAYDNLLHERWSMEKIISRFDRVSPICKPEKCYGYQNIAYGFLEPVIEKSQTENYASLLQDRIFTPLKMNHASVGFDNFINNTNTAKPHVLIKSTKTNKKDNNGQIIRKNIWYPVKVKPDFYKVAPSAGINSSITDLSKWLMANMGNSPSVLSPALIKEVTTPRIRTPKDIKRKYWKESLKDAHYGYGWRIYQFEDSEIIYHSGWVKGFRADIGYSPKHNIGFAMLMNAESNLINKLSHDFWQAVLKN